MKKLIASVAFLLCAISLSAQFPARQRAATPADLRSPDAQIQKLTQFFTYLNMSYVDTINNTKLVEDAINKVLSELDPHSAYLSPAEMKQSEESFSGSFSGIGVEFNVLSDTIIVVNTVVGGPAEKVGVLPNDRIVVIDSENVVGITQLEVPKKLRGPKGTVVEIGVVRRGEKGLIDFRIVRDNIPINTVDAAYLLAPGTGYIKVNRFANTTMSEFNDAFDSFGNIHSLVVDLRGNGGGLLGQAIEMSEFFLPARSVVVSTEGRLVPPEKSVSKTNGRFTKGNVIVLIDESSASASEIVAGAIQDWDRGLVVGRRSFGKGLVQRQYPLLDGSSVRITVARYHTPTGRVIQRPFEMGHTDEYYESYYNRFSEGGDTLSQDQSLQYKTLRKGRTVYGGGGIYPDVNVAADTTGYSAYWAQLVRRGVINEFITAYMDENRQKIESKFPDFNTFLSDYVVDEGMLKGLISLGEKRDVLFDETGFELSKARLQQFLKALVAQKIWSFTEYYRVINSNDNVVKEAEDILKNWKVRARPIL